MESYKKYDTSSLSIPILKHAAEYPGTQQNIMGITVGSLESMQR